MSNLRKHIERKYNLITLEPEPNYESNQPSTTNTTQVLA